MLSEWLLEFWYTGAVTEYGPKSAFSYDPDYVNHKDVSVSKMNQICEYFNAKNWLNEHNGMCCSGGKENRLPLSVPPELLKNLLTSSHSFLKKFLGNIRNYNTFFSDDIIWG